MISGILSGCGNADNASKELETTQAEEPETIQTEGYEIMEEPEIEESNQTLSERVGGKLYVGDEFTFGTYEQDNDFTNGAEDIEWIVLEKTGDNTYLCISKYVLDAQPFHNEPYYGDDYWSNDDDIVYNNWGTSDIRVWLNNDFYKTAFTSQEQENIVTTNNRVYVYKTTKDNDLSVENYSDNVCLLNWGQLDEYPGCVKVTEYAKAQGAPFIDDGTREHENCAETWILMSMDVDANRQYIEIHSNDNLGLSIVEGSRGITLTPAAYNHNNNDVRSQRGHNDGELEGIRPVITVTLEK